VSADDAELRIEHDLAGRGAGYTPTPATRRLVDLIPRLIDRFEQEADTAELPLPDGSVIRVVAVPEVRAWLEGVAVRLRAGAEL
jgi:hypothetical protein